CSPPGSQAIRLAQPICRGTSTTTTATRVAAMKRLASGLRMPRRSNRSRPTGGPTRGERVMLQTSGAVPPARLPVGDEADLDLALRGGCPRRQAPPDRGQCGWANVRQLGRIAPVGALLDGFTI